MNRALRCLILAGCSCLPAAAQANPAVEAAFATHCIACHGRDGEVNGAFDLRKFPAAADLVADPHLLGRIIEAVRDGEMPPEGEGDLQPAEREAFVKHLDGMFAESVQTRAPPGRTPVRRMNRFQYGNAVTDLLDLKVDLFTLPECIVRDLSDYFHPETGSMPDQVKVGNRVLGKGQLKAPRLEDVVPFPQDPRAANGYDNRADLLSLSPLLMESFLQLAASIFESPNFGPETCGAWTTLFEAPTAAEPVEQALAARLGPFLTRAFRRPVDRDTLDRYVTFATERLKGGAGFTAAMEAKEEKQLLRFRKQIKQLDLIVLDELGYVPTGKVGAELLFDVLSTAYERQSLIVTTNLPFEQWTEVLGSERLTGAALDRLTHRCHILEAKGESFRLRDARRRLRRAGGPS